MAEEPRAETEGAVELDSGRASSWVMRRRIRSTPRPRSPLTTSKSCSTLPIWMETSTPISKASGLTCRSSANVLVGPDGEVLDALQELTRLAVMTETGSVAG